MKSTIFFSISALIYISLLMIVFFGKKYYKTTENKVYALIIITSFIGLIIEVLGVFILSSKNEIMSFLQMKLYQVYLISWIGLFTLYTIIITNKKKNNILINISIVFYVLSIIIIFLLPTELHNDTSTAYTYGASINYVYLISIICIIIIVYKLIRNIKKIFYEKYLPMPIFILLGTMIMIIQAKYPSLLLISSTEAFITFLMYFTIENPDIKIMRELEYSRTIAENSKNETINTLDNIKKELSTPLNKIRNYNNENIDKMNKEELVKEVEKLNDFTNDFASKVFSLIELGKINSSDYIKKEDLYDTNEMIKDLKKLIEMNNEKIKYMFEIDENTNKVLYGDSSKIKQVILYLNKYLIKRIDNNKINIKISSLTVGNLCRLRFTFNVDKSFEKYLIKDKQDIYISEEDNFDYEIILNLLELLDGKISIRDIGNNICLTITIDQIMKDEYTINKYYEKAISSRKLYDYTGKKVIVFENKLDETGMLISLLKKYNITVTLCDDVKELNKLIAKDIFDLILIDDILPKIENLTYEESLKVYSAKLVQRFNSTNIPVIIMINNNNKIVKKKYQEYGYTDFIVKPVNKKIVDILLQKYLKK